MIAFIFSLPPVQLRRNHGQGKFTAKARAAYSETLHLEALAQGWRPGAPLQGIIDAEVIWFATHHGDTDNCLAGMKAMFDCLGCAPDRPSPTMTYLAVYGDDAQLKRICADRERVMKKVEERIEVTLTPRIKAAPKRKR